MTIKEATIFLAPIGVIKGGVFGHTRATRYLRRKYRPEVASPAQIQARTDWRIVDTSWQVLDEDKKQLWRDWKSYMKCWGYNRYMMVNYPRQRAGSALLDTPPDYPPWL